MLRKHSIGNNKKVGNNKKKTPARSCFFRNPDEKHLFCFLLGLKDSMFEIQKSCITRPGTGELKKHFIRRERKHKITLKK